MVAGRREDPVWLRPEQAPTGRPGELSRAQITAAAVAVADADGLDAVTMRRVAAALGTGAASLYRYVLSREDVLDLMTDAVAAGYELQPPTADWRRDLLDVARQQRALLRRHPWLAQLTLVRPALGPHGMDLLEHVVSCLAPVPASGSAKLEAFAVLTALVAAHVQNEVALPAAERRKQLVSFAHAVAAGRHPHLAALAAQAAPGAADPESAFDDLVLRVLGGLLGA
ncbi:TetR/AcrR family transcriptional regulator C-terminal domain-containing protein [Kineococcus glutinatus]|uniref:TetR/AcrR family transcriptional regulator C-terminal domain-containing protein n=1 Tax=Kineococcus glutinatus TaxID=1070872 RepID=A0ABP8VB80_9ACTN